ncbi:MAG TPA: chemotaxis protein CheB [Anaerolineae bacterium]|nr:chemotaxis protein CheB [Anaerolineae bacterium]
MTLLNGFAVSETGRLGVSTGERRATRVLVIDLASPLRDKLVAFLEGSDGVEVVGLGASGAEAVRLARRLRPDVMTMSAAALGPAGLQAIRQIMHTTPTPIVITSASHGLADAAPTGSGSFDSAHERGAVDYTFAALQAGALTVVNEPRPADGATYVDLLATVRLMAGVPVIHHWKRETQPLPPVAAPDPRAWEARLRQVEVIGIAASTGGPAALTQLLQRLSPSFPAPIIVVQHVTSGFTTGLAQWLDLQTSLRVRVARHGDCLQPGTVWVSPDNYHLQVDRLGKIELHQEPSYKGLRPSANYLFRSMAATYGARALGIILTGMGDDGVEGLSRLHRQGGLTVAQDEASSVVYGMPQAAVARRAVDRVLALEHIAALLENLTVTHEGS